MKKNNKKGFTITELVIVIAVIAILAAVLIPTFSGVIKKAKLSNDTQIAAQLNRHIDIYCIDNELDKEDLLGTDIKSIAEVSTYDLVPAYDDWTFVWNIAEKKVEVLQKPEDAEDWTTVLETTPVDPTNVWEGYYLLGNGNNAIEQAINKLVNLSDTSTYTEALGLFEATSRYKGYVEIFDPATTLYISNTGAVGKTDGAERVVFTIRTFTVDCEYVVADSAVTCVSQIVKTVSENTADPLKTALRRAGAEQVNYSLSSLISANDPVALDAELAKMEEAGVQILDVQEMMRVNQNNIPGITFNFGSSVVGTTRQEIVISGTGITVLYFNDTDGLVACGKMFA